jgi:hypothetical protein
MLRRVSTVGSHDLLRQTKKRPPGLSGLLSFVPQFVPNGLICGVSQLQLVIVLPRREEAIPVGFTTRPPILIASRFIP